MLARGTTQAPEQARRPGAEAGFRTGDVAATGLYAVLCTDAVHFAPQPAAACHQIRRILTCGGRPVPTNWQPRERDGQRLPGRLQRADLKAGLTVGGFEAVEVRDRPGWRASERALRQEAAALDPGDNPALRSSHDEGVLSPDIFYLIRRVIAAASAPQATGTPAFPPPTASEPTAKHDRLIQVNRTRSRSGLHVIQGWSRRRSSRAGRSAFARLR